MKITLDLLEDFTEGMEKVYRDKLKKSSKIYITSIEEGTSLINVKAVHV